MPIGKGAICQHGTRKRWCEVCQAYKKRVHALKRYGLTPESYEAWARIQNKLCAICKRPSKDKRGLFVDHNHVTGKLRSLLCSRCNWYVGQCETDPGFFAKIQLYLELHNGTKRP